MSSLGALGGALSVVGWGALNTYTAMIQGDFRNSHPGCHSIADMAAVLGGTVLKELIGALFLIAYVLCAGSGILGVSIGLNALSTHAACTVWWSFIAVSTNLPLFILIKRSYSRLHLNLSLEDSLYKPITLIGFSSPSVTFAQSC